MLELTKRSLSKWRVLDALPLNQCNLSVGRGPQKGPFLSHFRDFLFPETNFSFNSRYFGLQLSRFRPVLIYDMHGRKFHRPCSGLKRICDLQRPPINYVMPKKMDPASHVTNDLLISLNPLPPLPWAPFFRHWTLWTVPNRMLSKARVVQKIVSHLKSINHRSDF